MKITLPKNYNTMKKYRNLAGSIAGLLLLAALPQAAHADSYYWDADSITAGFGAAGGTWGTDAFWSTDDSGANSPAVTSPTTSDNLNFGAGVTGLGGGTVSVTGTQSAGTLTFASDSGTIVLSGGTAIDLAGVSTITVNNAADTITTPLTGAGTSLTKLGTGTLTLNGSNTYTGTTIIKNGALQIGDDTTGSLVGTNPLTFNGTGTFNVQEAASSSQGMGVLTFNSGAGNVISTAAGGSSTATLTFASMTARTPGATANFALATNTTASQNKILVTTLGSTVPLGGVSGTVNDPGIFFGLNSLAASAGYARYDATNGFRSTIYGTDANTVATLGGATMGVNDATKDFSFTTARITAQTTASVNTIMTTFGAATAGTNATSTFVMADNSTLSVNGIMLASPNSTWTARFGGGATVSAAVTGIRFIQPTSSGGELVLASSGIGGLQINATIQDNTTASRVTKTGPGTVVIQSGQNTYTGVTTINSGILRVFTIENQGVASSLGRGSLGAADIVINGGTLAYVMNVNWTTTGSSDRLFTIGTAGATLDASSVLAGGAINIGSAGGNIAFSDNTAPASLTLTGTGTGTTGAGTLTAVLNNPTSNIASLTKSGTGTWNLSAANTYTGNTTVNAGTLTLGSTGTLKFVPTANGVCNKITGAGTATLNGTFNIDLTNAAIANGNSWTLVDTTTKNGTLTAVTGFTGSSGVWTKVDGGNTWTYTESTGVLGLVTGGSSYTLTYTAGANGSITGTSPQIVASGGNGTAVTAVPDANYHFVNWSDSSTANPRTDSNVTANVSVTANFAINNYAAWALANSVAGGVNGDSNNDGVQNGVAYFMGVTGQTTNPGLNASNQVTWPVNPNYQGTFEVQISSDLIIWTPASPQPTPSAGNLTYTLPSGLGKQFVRLVVTPN